MVKAARPTRADYYRTRRQPATAGTGRDVARAALHHAPENFYLEDAMGLALPLALCLAIPSRRVR